MGRRQSRTYGARAIVTGAGSGIGRAFAQELARRGGQVVCADINLPAAKETVGLIEKAGGKAIAAEADVASEASVRALAATARDWFGLPTLLVSNAGIGSGGHLVGEGELSDWRRVMEVNLWGAVVCNHVFLPLLKDAGTAGLINVASAAGFAAAPSMASYNVTKAGVLALSETIAAELSGTGVAVTVLCPTFVPTAIFDGDLIDPESAKVARRLAERNGSTPQSVALAALDGLDKGRLYVLPQLDAKVTWRIKRLAPTAYPSLASKVAARMARP